MQSLLKDFAGSHETARVQRPAFMTLGPDTMLHTLPVRYDQG